MRWAAVVLLLAAADALRAESIESSRSAIVADIEDLVAWCEESRLLRSRNKLYELLLRIDADHEKARYWLRYQRNGDKWVRPAPYRAPLDRNPGAEEEFKQRSVALLARVEARLWPAIEEGGPQRRDALALLLAIDPDHKEARAANGEVRWRGVWILEESARAFARRKELQVQASNALRAVPAPQIGKVTEQERALGLPWAHVYQGQWWRLVSTVRDREELCATVRAADASVSFLSGAIADEKRPITPEGLSTREFVCYQLSTRDEGMRFLGAHPSFTAQDRKFAQSLGGTWVPGLPHAVNWREDPEGRRDVCCRHAVSVLLRIRYGHFKAGWLEEGFGIYLTEHLVGTRLTFYVARTQYALDESATGKRDLFASMRGVDANWLSLARRAPRPDLRFLASKGLNEMTHEDLLWSYALAAYFLEGRPDGLSEFLSQCTTVSLDEALAAAYGLTLPEIETRLYRWLDETS